MPWQRDVLDVALEVDENGVYRYPLVIVSIQRQSGKTTLVKPVMAHRCITVPDAHVYLTAQRRIDAVDIWQRIAFGLETSPVRQLIRTVRRSMGSESLEWMNGSHFRTFTSSKEDALHGKTTDLVAVDEAWAFDEENGRSLIQAIVPTQATRPGAQTWLLSTAGTARSVWFRAYVEAAKKELRETGTTSRVAFFDYGIPEDTEDLADLSIYAKHHPAVGHTIGMRALEDAYAIMGPQEFARAYGNFWLSSAEWVIDPMLWDARRTYDKIADRSPVAFAAELSVDRTHGVIVAAGRLTDGRTAVEVIEARNGVGWLAPRLTELATRHRPVAVVIDPYGPARPAHSAITENRYSRVPVIDFQAADLIAAHTEFMDGIVTGDVLHRNDHLGRLDNAVSAARTRTVREIEVFSRALDEQGRSPAALIASMLAVYGLRHPANTSPRPTILSAA